MEELKQAFYEVMYKYHKAFGEVGVMANLNAWAQMPGHKTKRFCLSCCAGIRRGMRRQKPLCLLLMKDAVSSMM